jgi:peptide-methionine (S)-S-oxide reductase
LRPSPSARATAALAPLVLALALARAAGAATPAAAPAAPAPRVEVATFAGGCFWCMETQFEGRPGVLSVVSGYTGGTKVNPTYEEVCTHTTGHYESIEVRFDPARVSYAALLDLFWHGIDPTQADGQFCDLGSPYRSAIFVHGPEQRRLAEESRRRLAASRVLKRPIVTSILDAARFWPAEAYHQDFWRKDPKRYREYRAGCGRDRRLAELWGKEAVVPLVH